MNIFSVVTSDLTFGRWMVILDLFVMPQKWLSFHCDMSIVAHPNIFWCALWIWNLDIHDFCGFGSLTIINGHQATIIVAVACLLRDSSPITRIFGTLWSSFILDYLFQSRIHCIIATTTTMPSKNTSARFAQTRAKSRAAAATSERPSTAPSKASSADRSLPSKAREMTAKKISNLSLTPSSFGDIENSPHHRATP